ncbi:MAG: TIGR03790 family protein [Puniceicoccales bacterium]|jgi:uncharacterized protein (TIGR03790 family)|nr:TIGR03790 family protein [Puniceicoccales bacterium]
MPSVKMKCQLFLLLFLFFPSLCVGWHVDARQVVVVANENSTDSLALARYYMRARSIPAANLIAIPLSKDEEISWQEFSQTLWNPLLSVLLEKKWLAGKILSKQDHAGRNRLEIERNRIGYLVLCHGVPLRIKNDKALIKRENFANISSSLSVSGAAVDSELALITTEDTPATSLINNPFYAKDTFLRKTRNAALSISRLDGPSLAVCQQLVNNTLLAEKTGLVGRAYIDAGGPYPQGDAWFRSAVNSIRKQGFDVTYDESVSLLDYDTRADAPAIYLGWYSEKTAGRFGDPKLHFVPGAIAMHLHSFSAITLRSVKRGWVASLISRNAAVSFGNVAEPYLGHCTHPALFISSLLEGNQVGEAYYRATPVWSWQGILIGDPLYRPFNVPIKEQIAQLKKNDPLKYNPAQHDYIILRYANLLLASGKTNEALAELATAIRHHPSLPLRFALARIAKHPTLAWSSDDATDTSDPGLLVEIARYLKKNASHRDALRVYKFILQHSDLFQRNRRKLLPEAIETATASGDWNAAQNWRKEE